MKTVWDKRYAGDHFVYGKEPNRFLASELEMRTPGKILLPGEGEGKNAVYAAIKGWEVDAFDQSMVGSKKALGFAREMDVHINYQVCGLDAYIFQEDYYDVVGLTFFHTAPPDRKMLHNLVIRALKPGGVVILEAFHTSQLGNGTGGPQVLEMLFDEKILQEDFFEMDSLYLEALQITLNEGPFHQGSANIVRFTGMKKIK